MELDAPAIDLEGDVDDPEAFACCEVRGAMGRGADGLTLPETLGWKSGAVEAD